MSEQYFYICSEKQYQESGRQSAQSIPSGSINTAAFIWGQSQPLDEDCLPFQGWIYISESPTFREFERIYLDSETTRDFWLDRSITDEDLG